MPFVFSWLLNGLYLLLITAVAPILLYRRVTAGKYRRGWNEKLTGRLTRQNPERMCIWFHAVSVGEVLQLQKVLDETLLRFPEAELFITVTTETGYDVAREKYARHTVSFFPLDFSWAVGRALTEIKPAAIVLVELELWPNLVLTAKRRGIPLILINGRMGAKSFKGYSRIRPLMARLLSCFDVLAVQAETYAERLRTLGAPADRVTVTGNIKFDRAESNRANPKTEELRRAFHLDPAAPTFIAGSTQDPEESCAIDAWQGLRPQFPQLQLILVPRHKERFDEVAELVRQRQFRLVRRSEVIAADVPQKDDVAGTDEPVIRLLDTIGELGACWGLADIAFVGGSLTNRGGQNMIEPAGYGAAVLFGPNTWNFKDVTEALLSHQAARVIRGPEELRETVEELLKNPDEMRRMGEAASQFVATQRGATERTVNLIAEVISSRGDNRLLPVDEATKKKTFWLVLKTALLALVLIFIGRRAYQLWEAAPPQQIRIHFGWLIAAAGCYLVSWLPSVWLWRAMLVGMGQPLDWWTALRAYYVGHLGKYVPGKALVLVIRGSLAKEAQVNPLLGGVTAAYETLIFMATGAAISLALAPVVFPATMEGWWPGQLEGIGKSPFLFPGLVAAATLATTPLSSWLFTRLGRKALAAQMPSTEKAPAITAGLISQGVMLTCFGWGLQGLSLGCVLQSMSDVPLQVAQFPVWLAACALSTVGGFVVLLAPGGIGVREGLLIEVLKDQPQIGPTVALVAAGLLRVVWFVTELLGAALFWFAGRGRQTKE
ncbi:glycosyltransferase N-terminal domain-containing protein [Schlesneria sp. T3-172]|uniref:glycosyltransferase N-terminal domain-containing protein n=1 Tax=Schlesneria sphaerica TaxID=3373610 RepID=UPI0037CC7F1C